MSHITPLSVLNALDLNPNYIDILAIPLAVCVALAETTANYWKFGR